jgi:hypothetical protein
MLREKEKYDRIISKKYRFLLKVGNTANKSKSWREQLYSGDRAITTNKKGARESFEK